MIDIDVQRVRSADAGARLDHAVYLAARGVGELLLTGAVLLLLFAVYELGITELVTTAAQWRLTYQLDRTWTGPVDAPPAPGDGVAKLVLPTIDASFTVVEGVTHDDLAQGPGHYPGTPLPGTPGNVAVAGHRVGHGAPFAGLERLLSCDPVIVETRDAWFVYRVLPLAEEVADWATGRGASPRCRGIGPPQGVYRGLLGRETVDPDRGDVVASVPGHAELAPAPDQQASLLTLTTGPATFSAPHLLVVHAELAARYAKCPVTPQLPAELGES